MDGRNGILDRVAFLVAANVNAIVNQVIEGNSIAVFDEYIRQVRVALDALISAEGVQRGSAKTLTRRIDAMRVSIEQADREVDVLLARGERGLAAVRQSVLNTRGDALARLEAQRAQCLEQVASLGASRANLSARIEMLEAERLQLEGILERKRAAQLHQKAVLSAGSRLPDTGRTAEILERAQIKLDREQGMVDARSSSIESSGAMLLDTDRVGRQLDARLAQIAQTVEAPALSAPRTEGVVEAPASGARGKRASGSAKTKARRPKLLPAQIPPAEPA